jgi:two-component system chemotaxis sensor kinase CheA
VDAAVESAAPNLPTEQARWSRWTPASWTACSISSAKWSSPSRSSARISANWPGSTRSYARNIAQLGRITKELQRVSMALRMVPIRGVFQKMSRVVRDIGAKQQKKVKFITSGEDTELDRTVVEELNDPLLHMIRNSMDHGIESPENARRPANRHRHAATSRLSSGRQHRRGNRGRRRGLEQGKILKKAIERGLATGARN